MRRLLLVALVCAIGLTSCQKEDEGNATDRGITTLTVSMPETSTRISLGDATYGGDNVGDINPVTWKEGDKLKLYELKSVTLRNGEPGYEIANGTAITMTLSSGAGTKNATFSLDNGMAALNPANVYFVGHAGDISRIATESATQNEVTALCVKITPYTTSNSYTISTENLTTNNKVWSENNLVFWGSLMFEGDNPMPIKLNPFSSMFDISISTAQGVPAFEISTLKFTVSSNVSGNFIPWKECVLLTTSNTLFAHAVTAQPTSTIIMPTGITIGADGASPLNFRLPLQFRFTGYHETAPTKIITIEVTAKSGKKWTTSKDRDFATGSTCLFDKGTTFVIDLVVDKDLN